MTATPCHCLSGAWRAFLSLGRFLPRAEAVGMQHQIALLVWREQWNAVIPRECCLKRSAVFAC